MVWTRLLGMLLGLTVYIFSIILAVFLIGLALGSGLGAMLLRTVRPRLALAWSQVLLTLGIAWTAWIVSTSLPYWPINPLLTLSPWHTFQLDMVRCLWAILPPTVLWGASFPLAVASLSRPGEDPGHTVGSVYAANTLGAIFGALIVSLALIPWIGTQNTQRVLIWAALAGGVLILLLLLPLAEWRIGSGPTAIVSDPASGAVLVVEDGSRSISTISVGPGDVLKQTSSSPIDPDPAGAGGPAGRGGASTAVLLPGRHAILVPLRDRAAALVYDIAADGTLHMAADLEGVRGGSAAALDPVTGRVFVSEVSADEVAVLLVDAPVAAAPSITDAVPGPFDVSLAPADVARSIGITMLLMLLLGAPTPIFNRTLSANRTLIERWVRRRRPKWMRGRRHLAGTGTRVKALSTTRAGLLAYLGLATLLYSFLEPTFPFRNGLETFGTTLFGIAVGTAVSQVPGELYVRRHYGQGGKVKVALWTLGLAAACVLITRVTAVEPGYVYGIIGGFTFAVVLSADDKGRMAFRGVTILLAVGFVAWFVRVPFQPGGPITGDGAVVANRLLARMFVTAVEGCAIGLIPLRYLEGEELFSWNRARWAVVWAMSLLLFAHVILYPVSSYEPSPSPTGLWTIALTVFVYSTLAIGFWWFFRQREVRRRRRSGPI